MTKTNLIYLCLSFFAVALQAQIVNVENKRLYSDSLGWSGSINASVAFSQVKYRTFASSFQPHIQWKGEKNYVLAFGSSDFSKNENTIFTNAQLIHLRYWHDIKGPAKWEAFTQFQYNPLISLKLRELVGTGMRFELIKKEKRKLSLGTSYMPEYEDIQPDRDYNINNRWSNYCSWFVESKNNISFSGVIYYQPRIDSFKDFRFSFTSSICTKVNKRVIIKLNYSQMFDSQPPKNVRNLIFNSNISLGYLIGKGS
jgi:hypothetical protein